MCEGETETERECDRDRDRVRERERECVCVRERETERERAPHKMAPLLTAAAMQNWSSNHDHSSSDQPPQQQ